MSPQNAKYAYLLATLALSIGAYLGAPSLGVEDEGLNLLSGAIGAVITAIAMRPAGGDKPS